MVHTELPLFSKTNDNTVKSDLSMILFMLHTNRHTKHSLVDEVGTSLARLADPCTLAQILGVAHHHYLVRMVHCESHVLLILENKALLLVLKY